MIINNSVHLFLKYIPKYPYRANTFSKKCRNSCMSTEEVIDREKKHGAHNYCSLPVAIYKGEGIYLWDVDDKRYFDFISAYSAVNQGHNHPKIAWAMKVQSNDYLYRQEYEKFAAQYFGYNKLLPMNTGSDAAETAIKLARRWGYFKKNIPETRAKVVFSNNNVHGSTLSTISVSTNPTIYEGFGPFMDGYELIPYGDLIQLEAVLNDKYVCAYFVEPIQCGEDFIIPEKGFLRLAKELCKKCNVLFVANEIHTGLGRTGRLTACAHENVRPDILIIGNFLSGGMYPVSAVLCDDHIMLNIKPGQHGSTFGGNPLGSKIAIAALEVICEEKLSCNAAKLGIMMRKELRALPREIISKVLGMGLLTSIVINKKYDAWELCLRLKKNGLLTVPTAEDTIRLAPPLVINELQMCEAMDIIHKSVGEVLNKHAKQD